MRRTVLLFAFAVACVVGGPSSAFAHAYLERSIPQANTATAQSPTQIVLRST